MVYRGIKIIKTYAHGYTYWRIEGEKLLYTTAEAAKVEIDNRFDKRR